MQLALTFLTSLALVATSGAVSIPRAAAFTTWDCNECARNGGGSSCHQINHQDIPSEKCFRLEPNQQSLVVDFTASPSCFVELYASTDCTGNGPTYAFDASRPCKPIPANERTSYQVICN